MQLLLALLFAVHAFAAPSPQMPDADWKFVRKQMKLAGLSEPFIKEMQKNYEPKDFEEVVRLNVLLFLTSSFALLGSSSRL